MKEIIEGVKRFQAEVFPKHKALFSKLAKGQSPKALFITCADSRISPSMITQSDPGELFICRNAGNIIPPHSGATGGMTASIEYAVAALNVPHIIVCGHYGCGAMGAAMNVEALERFPHVKAWLTFARGAVCVVDENAENLSEEDRFRMLVEQNVLLQLQHLRTHPYVAAKLAGGKVRLHGWVYDVETGEVSAHDPSNGRFEPLGADGASVERARAV